MAVESKEEIKELVNALRDAVVELKSVIMEAESPFREKPLQPLPRAKATVEAQRGEAAVEEEREEASTQLPSSQIGKPVKTVYKLAVEEGGAKGPPSEASEGQARSEAVKGLEKELLERLEAVGAKSSRVRFRQILELLNIFYGISSHQLQDNVSRIIRMLELAGYVGNTESELLRLLAEIADDSRKFKLRPEDNVIVAYLITKTLGMRDPEFEEELLKLLFKMVVERGEGDR